MDQDHVCASQLSHFEHKDEFMKHLEIIIQAEPNVKEATQALDRLTTIVSKRNLFVNFINMYTIA